MTRLEAVKHRPHHCQFTSLAYAVTASGHRKVYRTQYSWGRVSCLFPFICCLSQLWVLILVVDLGFLKKAVVESKFSCGKSFYIFPLKLSFSHVEATLGQCLQENSLRTLQHVVTVLFFSAVKQGCESLLCISRVKM